MSQETEAFIKLVCRLHKDHDRDEDCKLIDWLKLQADNFKSVDDLREAMVARKEWNAGFSIPTLVDCYRLFEDEDERDRVQMVYAKAILKDDPKAARGHVESAIRDHGGKIEDGAMKVLVQWLADNHPNPKAFLRLHLHHIPATSVLKDIPCPDFPELQGEFMRGARATKSVRKAERLKAAQVQKPA